MGQGDVQCAVAAHGHAVDATIAAARLDAIVAFDEGKEFANEEIFVAHMSVPGIDVEGASGGGRGDDEFADFAAVPQILNEIPASGADQGLLVTAESVEIVEDRI